MLKNGFAEDWEWCVFYCPFKKEKLTKDRKIPAQSCFPRSRLMAFVLEEDVFAKKKVRKKLMQTYISTHLFRAVGIRGRGALSPPDFDRQDKPIILRGQIMHDYAHYIISYPMPNPGISNLPTALFFLHNCYHSILTYKGKHNTAGTIKRMRICVSLRRFFRIWLAMLMICNN